MKFDIKRFAAPNNPTYSINYYVLTKPSKKGFIKDIADLKGLKHSAHRGVTCFSGLSGYLYGFKEAHGVLPNRVLYVVDFNTHPAKENHLDVALREWWVRTCMAHGLLPSYLGKTLWETGRCLLRIEDIDFQTLYMYLVTARNMQDEPHFVRAMHYLVEEKKLDFFLAYVLATRLCIRGNGHHLVDQVTPYSPAQRESSLTERLDISWAFNLKAFVDRKAAQKDTLGDILKKGANVGNFRFYEKIRSMGHKPQMELPSEFDKIKIK